MSAEEVGQLNVSDSDFLNVKLEEYKTLRSEVLISLQQGQAVLTFGVGALGLLLGFASGRLHEPAGLMIAALGVPAVGALVVIVWLGELARTRRLGAFIKRKIEEPVQGWLGEGRGVPAIEWRHGWMMATAEDSEPMTTWSRRYCWESRRSRC